MRPALTIAIAAALSSAAVAIPATAAAVTYSQQIRDFCKVVFHRVTVVKRVPLPPKPARIVYRDRLVRLECAVPLAINPPPVNTTFGPIDTMPLDLGHITALPPARQTILLAPPVGIGGVSPLPPVTSASVPEPASWVMMVAGFGIVGGVMRRRKGVWA